MQGGGAGGTNNVNRRLKRDILPKPVAEADPEALLKKGAHFKAVNRQQ